MRTARRLAARTVGALVALSVVGAGCGDDAQQEAADDRAEQVRSAALEAGLDEDVADVLALAARGAAATYQVTYPGPDDTSLVVSQDPPRRRVDVVQAGLIVESQVLVDGVSYHCTIPDGGRPGDELRCQRSSTALPGTGAFTEAALDEFTEVLVASADQVRTTVEDRTVAGQAVTCLVSTPRPETLPEGTEATTDTICLDDDGVQLLVDAAGERLVADAYSAEVPEGTFDV
ncbi:MAG: hypothetical protein ACO1PW_12730 [Actinomycetota bacterium]